MTGVTRVEIDDRRDMEAMWASTWQEIYKEFKVGLAVNDGKHLTPVNDNDND